MYIGFSNFLMKFLILDHCDRAVLSFEELTTVKRNLQTDGNVEVDYELIRETWHPVYRRHFLRKALRRCHDCRRGFFMYSKGIESDVSFRILSELNQGRMLPGLLTFQRLI